MQFFVHGRNSGKSLLPDGRYVWDWSHAQVLEALAEEKEIALSRLLKKTLSTITKAEKLLFLIS